MALPLWLLSIILGVIEGLTEFIPVSSTGHLIIADHFLQFKEALQSADKAELFEIVIQLGAILAVGYIYKRDLWLALNAKDPKSGPGRLRTHLFIAFLPAAVVGFLFHSTITKYLFSPLTVSISLIIGGIIIVYVESFISVHRQKTEIKTMTMKDALIVGFSQVVSLIPGVSRSGATIIGGMSGGMTRTAATEFSFLLSFPIMIAATIYDLFKHRDILSSDMMSILAIGFLVAFISALVVVRWLIKYVRSHSFTGFGIYRIV
ncbi:MAG: undecaprenyl-diphosphate phosphatase, partial [Bacteroidota bacterium]|nr:undecaprenyl-diphosphate phosphatase [Bacteroidota bacterium]